MTQTLCGTGGMWHSLMWPNNSRPAVARIAYVGCSEKRNLKSEAEECPGRQPSGLHRDPSRSWGRGGTLVAKSPPYAKNE